MVELLPEFIDQVLHLFWFFCLAVVLGMNKGSTLTWMLVIASFTILPREFIDQGDGGLPGVGKMTDIFFCYLGTFFGWWVRRS